MEGLAVSPVVSHGNRYVGFRLQMKLWWWLAEEAFRPSRLTIATVIEIRCIVETGLVLLECFIGTLEKEVGRIVIWIEAKSWSMLKFFHLALVVQVWLHLHLLDRG